MNLEIKDQVQLNDGNTYAVASVVQNNGLTYYYLVDINNNANLKFCYENKENGTLVEVNDKKLIQTLLPEFFMAAKDTIEELINETED
ncbi:MAG: hypothetical protein K2J20_06260 [Bacilli bacterium]|nr:hypothetical protein [Bacilli bacterium]